MSLNIVILDGGLANPGDLSWEAIEKFGHLTVYPNTEDTKVLSRSSDADILVVNKIKLNRSHFDRLPKLKLICLLATGYDNVNIEDANKADITVCNAVGYGVNSVAQHVFAHLLNICNQVATHNRSVQKGMWSSQQWSYTLIPLKELSGKTFGIYGFGKIGQKVAEIAKSFGMKILAHHKHPGRDATPGVEFVSLEALFQRSDVISLHAPLNKENIGVVNAKLLGLMPTDSILINTGRGGLIAEKDLKDHLQNRPDVIAALDVLSEEPPNMDHPLIGLENCIITPHNAWATKEARNRLIDIVGDNIQGFIEGKLLNVVIR